MLLVFYENGPADDFCTILKQKLEASMQQGISTSMGIGESHDGRVPNACLKSKKFAYEIRHISIGGGLNLMVTSLASAMSGKASSCHLPLLFVY